MYHTYYEYCVTIIVFLITLYSFPKTTASPSMTCVYETIIAMSMMSGLDYQFTAYMNIIFMFKMICVKEMTKVTC